MRNGEYELILPPEEYSGKRYRGKYCYEHHFVWWRNTGEIVSDNFIIHHINENKRDNEFKNLEKLTHAEHMTRHVSRASNTEIMCTFCRKHFNIRTSLLKFKLKKGQKDFYCSRYCMSSHFGRGRSKR